MALLTFFGRYGPNIPSGNVHDQELKPPKDVGAIIQPVSGSPFDIPKHISCGAGPGVHR